MMLLCVTLFGAGANLSARDQGLPSTIAHVAEGAIENTCVHVLVCAREHMRLNMLAHTPQGVRVCLLSVHGSLGGF